MTHPLCRAWLPCVLFLACSPAAWAGTNKEDEDLARRITVAQLPTDGIAEPLRSKVTELLHRPTVYCRGPVEAFPCQPAVYHWLVDHPQWGFRAWKALGVNCAKVEEKDDGTFSGADPLGSEMRWQTVFAEPGRRLWYAEGAARAAPFLPGVTLRVLLLLRYQEVVGADGRIGIRHRAELFAQCDLSKATKLIAKLWGMPTDAIAEKAAEQVELFFSGVAWYVSENPGWARDTFQQTKISRAKEAEQLGALLKILATTKPQGSVSASGINAPPMK